MLYTEPQTYTHRGIVWRIGQNVRWHGRKHTAEAVIAGWISSVPLDHAHAEFNVRVRLRRTDGKKWTYSPPPDTWGVSFKNLEGID
jgi:hypothetical protein